MESLNEALSSFKDEVFVIKSKCITWILTDSDLSKSTARLVNIATRFNTIMRKMPTFNKKVFIDKNACVLFKIHDILVGQFARTYMESTQIEKCRKPHDTFFNNLDIRSPRHRFARLPTIIFNEFVRGITYFEIDHKPDNPIYHREES